MAYAGGSAWRMWMSAAGAARSRGVNDESKGSVVGRRGLGWSSILVLGVAFGIVEEGLALESLFNPSLFNAGDLGGRALGINWVWAQWTLGYHAVWSISIPILLAELVFPARRSEPWLGRAGLITTGVFYVLGVLAFTPTSATRRKTSLATCAEA